MNRNGSLSDADANGHVLHWPGRVLAADDLRRSLNGHREVVLAPAAVVTPLAGEHLRAAGIPVRRREAAPRPAEGACWGYAQDRPHPLVASAVQALGRDGVHVAELPAAGGSLLCRWAHAVAARVARGDCRGGVLFCDDPGLVCCVANKLPGLRAAAAWTVAQAVRAATTLNANLVSVEMPGRTFFEVRQILRTLCAATAACPEGVAGTLQELDGHAHR